MAVFCVCRRMKLLWSVNCRNCSTKKRRASRKTRHPWTKRLCLLTQKIQHCYWDCKRTYIGTGNQKSSLPRARPSPARIQQIKGATSKSPCRYHRSRYYVQCHPCTSLPGISTFTKNVWPRPDIIPAKNTLKPLCWPAQIGRINNRLSFRGLSQSKGAHHRVREEFGRGEQNNKGYG